jgi:flagellar hook protein FlgE
MRKDTNMNISFSSALSGIQTVIKREEISAANIANVNTSGFEKYSSSQTEKSPAGVRIASISRTLNSEGDLSNTDLSQEMVNQLTNKNELRADAKVIHVQNEMVGALLDIIA